MPDYKYTARTKEGQLLHGKRQAASSQELAAQLLFEGLIPLDIDHRSKIKTSKERSLSWFQHKVSQNELQIFCRQMYTLIHAGIPLSQSIERLEETTRNKLLSEALKSLVVNLNMGNPLHVAMAKYPRIFSSFFINLIRVGENTGTLDIIFRHLAEYLALELDIGKKVKVALRYPTMVISAIIIASLIINVFVVPSFAKLYASMQGELPLPTLILISVSNFIIHYWYVLILILILLILGIRQYLSTLKGARLWGYLQLKIPIIGWIIQRILLSRFARLLSLVLRAGITAIEGIDMIGASTNNVYVAEKIRGITDLIIRGNSISTAIEKIGLFSPLIIQMIALGEESGTIDTLLDEVADYYQREIDYDIGRLSETIEPILLVVIGGMVLVLALAVFLPTWNLATLMKNH